MVLELLLVFNLVLLGIQVIITDLKRGIVKNRDIAFATVFGLIINAIYYCEYARSFFRLYLVNLLVISVLSILLFLFHYWAAGDSKLLICLTILIPGRLYDQVSRFHVPGITYIVYIFLLAYIYVIFESVFSFIRKERFFKGVGVARTAVLGFLRDYITIYFSISLVTTIWQVLFGEVYWENYILFGFFNVFTVVIISEKEWFKKAWFLITVLLLNAAVFIMGRSHVVWSIPYFIRTAGILLSVLLIRYFINGYNYQEIPTADVKKGMVLSFSTILDFQRSRIIGLPLTTSEDMSSRITEEEATAILKWGNSKTGKPYIVIVKKIPFAIFIVLGIIGYIFIRILK